MMKTGPAGNFRGRSEIFGAGAKFSEPERNFSEPERNFSEEDKS